MVLEGKKNVNLNTIISWELGLYAPFTKWFPFYSFPILIFVSHINVDTLL